MDSFEESIESSEIDIAVIGMACRFPGADDIESFWRNLRDGVESIKFFTDEELLNCGVSAETLADPYYIKATAQISDIDGFDAAFFGYTPREAAETDPQHRLFLEVAWHALEDAGYDSTRFTQPIGVYAGCGVNTYLMLNLLTSGRLGDKQDISALQGLMNGNNKDSMTTTVAYKLNLRGPGITVQTACSTSLAAVHVACRGLLNHETDIALAGGSWVNLLHDKGYHYQTGAILSPDGHCRAFDAKAAGTVIGSGAGIVVLKRLADALADGDTIHAVIKGSAINNDGSAKAGYTAPSIEGQAEVILAAQTIAGVSADTIGYVEAHGTGTKIGDPIEVAALTQAFRETTDRRGFCGIGSVKTNVGHLDAAAGVAGLIKTVLALKHRTLPPSLHFEQPNPQIDFGSSPFYVVTGCRPWLENAVPRRAGVSSFGIGGTNVHMIVEEAPVVKPASLSRDWQLLLISARSQNALDKSVTRLRDHIVTHSQQPLADIAYTLQLGRRHFSYRAIALCRNHDDAASVLQHGENDRFLIQAIPNVNRSIAFMFPGQGAQHVDMARNLYQQEPIFRAELDRCLELLQTQLKYDLRILLFPQTDEERLYAGTRLEHTEVTQPALFAIEYALAKLWMSWGIQPLSMIGHSIGEYVAACIAEVFTLEDAIYLIAVRGRLLQQLDAGAMLAVALSESELAPFLRDGCDLSAINGKEMCVIAGSLQAIEVAEKALNAQGIFCQRLSVSHAFHSSMVEAVVPAFVEAVAKLKLRKPRIPFYSNVSGSRITLQQATDANYWGQHMRSTVRFNDGLEQLLSQSETILLEVGPSDTLTKLAQRHPAVTAQHIVLSSLPHRSAVHITQQHLYWTLGKLWLNGVEIDWSGFYENECRCRVPLPGYPFERQSYWIDAEQNTPQSVFSNTQQSDIDGYDDYSTINWLYLPTWRRADAGAHMHASEKATLHPADCYLILGNDDALSFGLLRYFTESGVNSIYVSAADTFKQIESGKFTINPGKPKDFEQLLRVIGDRNEKVVQIFHLWSLRGGEDRSAQDTIDRVFYSLLNLAKVLESDPSVIAQGKKITITLITNGLADVTGVETLYPENALLYGPCKVIPQEYPTIDCRMIDIESQRCEGVLQPRLIRKIAVESQHDSDNLIVAYRGPYRWKPDYQKTKQPLVENRLKHEGVYFITGGLGGIGLTLANHLAERYHAKLVLLGRTALPDRMSWQSDLSNAAVTKDLQQKISAILQLEALGAEVLTLQADVSDIDALQSAVSVARQHFGRIDGVIHSAGEVGTGLMAIKSNASMARVLAPKVQGMQALRTVFQDDALDFMLLCSSLAAIAGGLSKIDYCSANAYLDAVAHQAYRDSNYPIFSVNWDGWREVGMAADMDMPEGIGIAPEQGIEIFEQIVKGPSAPQIIVSTTDLLPRLHQSPHDLLAQPLSFAEPSKNGRFPRPTLQTPFKPPEGDLETGIAEIWQNLLGIETVGVDDNLFELGGDSLLGIQLLAKVRANFSIDLHPADFFRSPTIGSLAILVESKLLDEIEFS